MKGQLEPAGLGDDLGLEREGRVAGPAHVAKPEDPPPRRLAAPEAVAIVAGVPPPLVESHLLLRRDIIDPGPIPRQVIDPREQVEQSIAVPVECDDLNDPTRPNPQVRGDSQALSRG